MKTNFAKRALIICAALLTLNPVSASQYKNSVLNLKFNKEGASGIKVNVVTAKPYSAPLNVLQKGENKYVILLPETDNTTKMSPIIDNYSELIKSVSISTVPYTSNGIKGYSKITIMTQKPINVNAIASLPISANNEVKKIASSTKKVEQNIKKEKNEIKNNVNIKNTIAQNNNNNKLVENKINKQTVDNNIKVKELEVKEQKFKNDLLPPEPDILIKHKELLEEEEKKEQNLAQENTNENNSLLNDFVTNLGVKKTFLLLSAIGFPLIIILLIIIMNKKLKKKINAINNSNEQEIVYNTPNIEENVQEQQFESQEVYNNVIDDFNEDEFKPDIVPEENIVEEENSNQDFYAEDTEVVENVVKNTQETFAELLEKDESPEYYETPINLDAINYHQPQENNFSSEQIEEILPNDEVEDTNYIQEEKIQTVEEVVDIPSETSEPEVLEDNKYENNVETIENIVEENNIVTTEEVYCENVEECYEPDGFINSYESNNFNFNEILVTDELIDNTLSIEQQEINNDIDDDSIIDEISKENDNDEIFDELISEQEDIVVNDLDKNEEIENDDLQLLCQLSLSENKGLYLVNNDNIISLIGYIDEEVFVLKTFEEIIKNNITYRLAEQISESCNRYFIRVDKYKMIIEVTDTKIEHVIDL